jgi:hypothetical protein
MSKVVQFTEARKEKQEHLRREYERVLFNRILGCYCVVEKVGLKSVEMRDISRSGCSFRMPVDQGAFNQGEEIDFRFYFSNNTYLPAHITVKRVLKIEDAGQWYYDFGCVFDQSASTFAAVEKFVDFINAYAMNAKEDKGELSVWF